MPKRGASQRVGYRAEAFVSKTVADAGFIWNDRRRDFGIDGQIETVSAAGEVTGEAVLVQVKGTERGFPGETDSSIRLIVDKDHIDYWLRIDQPVIVVCVDLSKGQAWWKLVGDWFSDPSRRTQRAIEFDKKSDRFDVTTVGRILQSTTSSKDGLTRLAGNESLISNMLAVESFGPTIWSASSPCRVRDDAWERMRANGAFESGFHLSQGKIFAMTPLHRGALSVLCDGPVTEMPTEAWAGSEDPDLRKRFVSLLNFTLRSAHHPDLVWHSKKRVVYFQAPANLARRRIKGRRKGPGRSFFMPYYGKDAETKVKYCRHYAADLRFRRWEGRWFLEINPDYHFTIDGKRDSLYDEEYVSKIKRRERNSAVLGLVQAWADYLRGEDTLFSERDRRIVFGDLLTFEADAFIDEAVWIPPSVPEPLEDGGLLSGLWEFPS